MNAGASQEILKAQGQLVLSVFPGIGLLDRAFEDSGFCVVRGPDKLWGGDVRRFNPLPGHFAGVIGGPPCQNFTGVNRTKDFEAGMGLVREYLRIVMAAKPDWALMENVPGSPVVELPGYLAQLFTLNANHVGSEQHRLRKFHFFHRPGTRELVLPARNQPGTSQPGTSQRLALGARRSGRAVARSRSFAGCRACPLVLIFPASRCAGSIRRSATECLTRSRWRWRKPSSPAIERSHRSGCVSAGAVNTSRAANGSRPRLAANGSNGNGTR